MEIYLIRHGETGGNLAHRHQPDDTPLTKHGEEQARVIAKTVKDLEPTHLITSPLVRAVETARVIGTACDLIPETNEYFAELARPPHLYGNYHKGPQSLLYYARWYFGYKKGGESYAELRDRISQAKEFFKNYPDDARVVVVSHTVFINLFNAHLCDDTPLNLLQATRSFWHVLRMKNTALLPLVFDPEAHPETCGWLRVEE
jgi:probable phosphoglycerate mutase